MQGSVAAKLKMIDYTGVLLSSSATIFLLIPISGGGSTFAWSSPTTIALLVLGVVCLVGFVVAEAKIAKLPILPREPSGPMFLLLIFANLKKIVRLFKMWTPSVVMILSFLIGMIYYGVSPCHGRRQQQARRELMREPAEHILYTNIPTVRERLLGLDFRCSCARLHTAPVSMGNWCRVLRIKNESLQTCHCKLDP